MMPRFCFCLPLGRGVMRNIPALAKRCEGTPVPSNRTQVGVTSGTGKCQLYARAAFLKWTTRLFCQPCGTLFKSSLASYPLPSTWPPLCYPNHRSKTAGQSQCRGWTLPGRGPSIQSNRRERLGLCRPARWRSQKQILLGAFWASINHCRAPHRSNLRTCPQHCYCGRMARKSRREVIDQLIEQWSEQLINNDMFNPISVGALCGELMEHVAACTIDEQVEERVEAAKARAAKAGA